MDRVLNLSASSAARESEESKLERNFIWFRTPFTALPTIRRCRQKLVPILM